MQLASDNDTLILRLSGTLSNGTYVGIMMKVSIADIEATDNQIIYDGQEYSVEGLVRHNAGLLFPYWMECNSNECPVRIRIEVQPNTIGNTINLASSTADFAYRVVLFIPDTTVAQSNYEGGEFTGEVTASYWDIPMQSSTVVNGSLFSSGTLMVGEDDVALTFNLSGVLACGHSVSTQVRIDKSEIEEIDI